MNPSPSVSNFLKADSTLSGFSVLYPSGFSSWEEIHHQLFFFFYVKVEVKCYDDNMIFI